MKAKLIIASIVVAAMASPALADYYVVQNTKTHKCSVAAKKPSAKSKQIFLMNLIVPFCTKAIEVGRS